LERTGRGKISRKTFRWRRSAGGEPMGGMILRKDSAKRALALGKRRGTMWTALKEKKKKVWGKRGKKKRKIKAPKGGLKGEKDARHKKSGLKNSMFRAGKMRRGKFKTTYLGKGGKGMEP